MVCYAALHPGLRSLLEFEEQRLGVPFCVRRENLADCSIPPFRPVLDVVIHFGHQLEWVDVLIHREHYQVRCPIGLVEDEQHFGFVDGRKDLHPLAGVTRNQVHVYLDLQWLFQRPGTLTKVGGSGEVPAHRLNQLVDLFLPAALTRAARNISRYDWREERREYLQCTTASRECQVREWKNAIRINDLSIQDKSWELSQLASKNQELREQVRCFEKLTRKALERRATEDHQNLVRMIGRGLDSLQVTETEIRATTDHIDLYWNGTDYDLGRFEIRIPLREGTLTIHQKEPDRIVDGFPHPHVNSQGVPCLGNIAGMVRQFLGEGEVFQLVTLLLTFLRSYNEDNPYLRLERWDPDWEDDDEEDRWESCYSDASLSDCATCSDWDCPYRDGAESRCTENRETETCIECALCSRHQDALEECRSNHSPPECVTCTRECAFAGDEYACFESHDGEECSRCGNENCSNYPEEDDETERRTGQAVSAA
jgi:hypothetical protein